MKKKKTKKETVPRIVYSKEVEAAWYVLKNFINPLDSAEKVDGKAYPFNTNAKLACIYSGYDWWLNKKDPYRPSYFSKARLDEHLNGKTTYYYRSHYNSVYTDGYGSWDSQAQKLNFAKELGITHKVVKYDDVMVVLLGIDIDAHNGEKDVSEVENWLKNEYFINSYWEPSTGGKGSHGYVKIAFNYNCSRAYILSTITELFKLLDMKRELLGFEAPVDRPCGLFSTISLSDKNHYPEHPIQPSDDKYIKYNRSQCFKIPRFNHSNIYSCSMEDIFSFYSLTYYSFNRIEGILNQLRQELNCGKEEIIEKGEEENTLTIVCSPQANVFLNKETESDKIIDLCDYWRSKNNTNKSKPLIYQQRIKECRTIQDTMEKTRKFYWYYSLYKKEVPSVDDAINEYITQGLNTNSNIISKKRYTRFKSCRKFISERFDLSKTGFNLDDWDEVKHGYINQISETVKNIELFWVKDSKRKKNLKVEDLAMVYFAIKKSGEYDRKNKDKLIKNSLSYKMVKKHFKVVFDKSCHRAKSARMLKVLKDAGLIVKTKNYIPGVRGNCYVVAEVYALFNKADKLKDWIDDMSMDNFIESLCA